MRYEKGRKNASRDRIIEVAAERFRNDGIAASGLATIMGDAGLTNGAFYPHFGSKAELVRESVAAALDAQSQQIRDLLDAGGLDMAISAYLSPEHRDNPATGCASAALLPEISRQSSDIRQAYTDHFLTLVRQVAEQLPQDEARESAALGIFATLVGALQLARAIEGSDLSDRILTAGKETAIQLAHHHS